MIESKALKKQQSNPKEIKTLENQSNLNNMEIKTCKEVTTSKRHIFTPEDTRVGTIKENFIKEVELRLKNGEVNQLFAEFESLTLAILTVGMKNKQEKKRMPYVNLAVKLLQACNSKKTTATGKGKGTNINRSNVQIINRATKEVTANSDVTSTDEGQV